MVTQPQTRIGMPLDEFLATPEDQLFELIDGERIYRMPNYFIHSYLIRWLVRLLEKNIDTSAAWEVFQETMYAVGESTAWVRGSRIPDVMVISRERYRQFRRDNPRLQPGRLRLVPDLTVKLVSATETADETAKKVAADLANGVQTVWVIDMSTQAARVHTAQGAVDVPADGTLTSELLPGFSLSLPALFAALDEA